MDTTMKISTNRLLLLKKLLQLRDTVININESQELLSDELKNLENKTQKKDNNVLNFIKSEDFKRLCIATYCNLNNSFSYTLCHYENHSGMWCVTSNEEEKFNDNNSIMKYIGELTSKYGFEILDFINTIEKEKYESFSLNHFKIDEFSNSLQEKIQSYYRLQLSNMVEDYTEEMKMQVTFRPSVPYESCSAYRKKQVDLVEDVSKLKDEFKEKLENLIYVIPDKFIKEENLTKIQSYYLMKFQEKQVINEYDTFLPIKYIFNECALNYFVKYIYNEQADNIEQCINIFEHREPQEETIEQIISLRQVVDKLKNSIVEQVS